MKIREIRMQTFFILFGCFVISSCYVLITLRPRTLQYIQTFHENSVLNTLNIDPNYLKILGFSSSSENHRKFNFTVVSYVLGGKVALTIPLIQNIASKLPNETLLLYDIGFSEDDSRALNSYCNNTKCSVIIYDLSRFPAYVSDERMHAFRPLLIKDALNRSKSILFVENNVRMRTLTNEHRSKIFRHVNGSGVLGWTTSSVVSSRTHPKMFDYFQTDAENFFLLPLVSLNAVLFVDSDLVNEKILLPWIKCILTLECIEPIGAQSDCRLNEIFFFKYSGCHAYDVSVFNIILGLTWNFDETKYSLCGDSNDHYVEILNLKSSNETKQDSSKNVFTNGN